MHKRSDYDPVTGAQDHLAHSTGHTLGYMFRDGTSGALIASPLGLLAKGKVKGVLAAAGTGEILGSYNGYLKARQERNLDQMILSQQQKMAYEAGRDYAIKMAGLRDRLAPFFPRHEPAPSGIVEGIFQGAGQAVQGLGQGIGKIVNGIGTLGRGVDNEFARMNPNTAGQVALGLGALGGTAYMVNQYDQSQNPYPGAGYQPAPF